MLVSDDGYREEFEGYIRRYLRVCSKGSRLAKLATNQAIDLDYEDFFREYIKLQTAAVTSSDFHEVMAAYREKHEPVWA